MIPTSSTLHVLCLPMANKSQAVAGLTFHFSVSFNRLHKLEHQTFSLTSTQRHAADNLFHPPSFQSAPLSFPLNFRSPDPFFQIRFFQTDGLRLQSGALSLRLIGSIQSPHDFPL
jgi:hypothetical protein